MLKDYALLLNFLYYSFVSKIQCTVEDDKHFFYPCKFVLMIFLNCRYLKILVDVLQQNVESMEAKIQKNDQFLSNGHVYGVFRDDNTQKSSSIYTVM